MLVGVVAGITAGLLGVGGGVIMVPAMVLLVGIPAAVAKGSSLAVIIPTALVGTQRNLKKGNADLRVAVTIGLSGVVSSFLASQISVELDEQLSNRLFAALLAFVSVQTAVGARAQETAEILAAIPEVLEVHRVVGDDCFFIKVRVRDTTALGTLLDEKIQRLPPVASTRTTIVLSTAKQSTLVPRAPAADESSADSA